MSATEVITFGLTLCAVGLAASTSQAAETVKYCRFQAGDRIAYGIVEGDRIRELSGDLFGEFSKTDRFIDLKDVRLLVPSEPKHVFAMAGNYKSHLGDGTTTRTITTTTKVVTDKYGKTTTQTDVAEVVQIGGEIPEKFRIPQPFFKSSASLIPHEGKIIYPKDANVVHYEAEMVVVIGRHAKDVSKEDALDYVLGVTIGNDVSERPWQRSDVQWWRAKGADSFGPCGPYLVSGLDYDNLLLQLRLNGETVQKERTSQLIHDVRTIVSFISQSVTLQPGDLIFTGTPGRTSEIKPGDVVEVELEGVGVLRNQVAAE